jgi:hypothetical protein
MSAFEQTASIEAIKAHSIDKIAHDMANSLNNICSTVQLFQMDLKSHQGQCQELNRELITGLEDECSRMKSRLEELRRFHMSMTS